jgi:hypothetical protein
MADSVLLAVAGSATFSLVDPLPPHRHVGQALVDFLPDSFMRALKEHTPVGYGDSGFPVIITPQPDVSCCMSWARVVFRALTYSLCPL